MKKLLTKAQSPFSKRTSPQKAHEPHQASTIIPPTTTDLYRYRYTHGVNLGSIFVLEKWLSPSMFPSPSSGSSELDAVLSSVSTIGLEATTRKWEEHWRSAITDSDLQWLVREARCNGLRIPIGFFTLGPDFCKGTEFEAAGSVYRGAWEEVKRLVRRAGEWGLGVLLDFHALYGGANGEAHSGVSREKAGLWGDREALERNLGALRWIVGELGGVENLVGVQVVNEAEFGAKGVWEWYEKVLDVIKEVDPGLPVYVSDAWDLKKALEWAGKRRGEENPVVVDTHRYFTFSERDRSQSPHQIIARIGGELGELDGTVGSVVDRGAAQIVIGEWSCVLDGRTWSRVKAEERDGLVRQFGMAQSQKWQQGAGGSYFWTLKMDWMDGGEWGFVEQTKKGSIVPPSFLTLSASEVQSRTQAAQARRQVLVGSARRSHEEYWNRTCPGKNFEHGLYSEGWNVGFSDAMNFFSMRADGALGERFVGEGGDKIGCLEIWARKRLLESGKRGEFIWEWEQGFRSGVAAFYKCVEI